GPSTRARLPSPRDARPSSSAPVWPCPSAGRNGTGGAARTSRRVLPGRDAGSDSVIEPVQVDQDDLAPLLGVAQFRGEARAAVAGGAGPAGVDAACLQQ